MCQKFFSYYYQTGTIRPVLSNPTQGPTKPTIPFMELNIPPHTSRNHKVSPPHTSTSQFHHQNPATNQPHAQANRCDLSTAPPQEPYPQSHPLNNYQHYATQRPTTETITPQDSPFHSATYPFLDQMKVIKQLMLDMQQSQCKLLQTMNQS